ncbi:MAG: hypothetical protein FJ221_10205 [Lentisphaerae bacterium]|nr:hypothetical protein [Lentisphaerota bacterium]
MKFTWRGAGLAVLLLLVRAGAEPPPIRTWTSQSGAKLEAGLVRVDGPRVVLQSADGRQFQVLATQLSAGDQSYLKEQGVAPAAAAADPAPLPSAPPPPPAGDLKPEWAPGEIHGPVACKADEQFHYFVYVPASLAPGEPAWPVMFVMSPGGGNAGGLKRYRAAADLNGVVLALSQESRNNSDSAGNAVRAMIEDAFKRLPRADPAFAFASGFSGGSRMSFLVADILPAKLKGGILACGAATHNPAWKPGAQLPVYGLSGTRCFNRWDMACLMEKNGDMRHLRFFPGAHAWADEDPLCDGMTWLMARAHARASKTTAGKASAERWAARILAQARELAPADPVRAWRAIDALQAASPGPPLAGAIAQVRTGLQSRPEIRTALAAEKDVEAFWRKHFKTNPMDCENNNGTEAAAKDGATYAATYKGTPYEALFTEMGQPTPKK